MHQYLQLLRYVKDHGVEKSDRTGVGVKSVFGHQMRFDLQQGFPAVTTKKLYFKAIVHELLWFLRGETNIASLQESGVSIWDEWADQDGNLGPVYGHQWRSWPTANGQPIDQIAQVIDLIKNQPDSRRMLVSAWNVSELDQMALQPCHVMFQFYVSQGRLSCQVYQRSADIFLGLPFNIASYALLTCMVAKICGLERGELVHTLGDAHLYANHVEQAELQLRRSPMRLSELVLHGQPQSIDDFSYESIQIQDYQSHPMIRAAVAV